MSDLDFMGGAEKSELDPSYQDSLSGFDPKDEAEGSDGRTDLPSFGHYIGTVEAGEVRRVPFGDNHEQASFKVRITEGLPGTVGRQARLQFDLIPNYEEKVGTSYVETTDPEKRAAFRRGWQQALARIVRVLGLDGPLPTKGAEEWVAPAIGKTVVFAAYSDKKGFAVISCRRLESGKYQVALRSPDEPATDRKGPIPGVTQIEQARAAIAKVAAKS